jgi:hypothetical protein
MDLLFRLTPVQKTIKEIPIRLACLFRKIRHSQASEFTGKQVV